jgi:hypothetical protein
MASQYNEEDIANLLNLNARLADFEELGNVLIGFMERSQDTELDSDHSGKIIITYFFDNFLICVPSNPLFTLQQSADCDQLGTIPKQIRGINTQ